VRAIWLILLSVVFSTQANVSKKNPIGTVESFIYMCDQFRHVPAHTPTGMESFARMTSNIPDEKNISVVYYLDCTGYLYAVKVKYFE